MSGRLKSPTTIMSLQGGAARMDRYKTPTRRCECYQGWVEVGWRLGGIYTQHTERGMCKWRCRETASKWSGLDIAVARIVCLTAANTQPPLDLQSLLYIM